MIDHDSSTEAEDCNFIFPRSKRFTGVPGPAFMVDGSKIDNYYSYSNVKTVSTGAPDLAFKTTPEGFAFFPLFLGGV
jgi:hypothetical protein